MNISTIVVVVFSGALVVAYTLWDFGTDCLLASFGRFVVRAVTFGRVRVASDLTESGAMGVAAATLIVIFLSFLFRCFTRALTWTPNHLTNRCS
jgi:hypothetical protein